MRRLIQLALQEDLGSGDLTTRALIKRKARVRAQIVAKAPGVAAGTNYAHWVFETLDPKIKCAVRCRNGRAVRPGQVIMTVSGPTRSILSAERVALNGLGHLSGVATLTRQFVERVRPYRVRILDTRKTFATFRLLERQAVRAGGGHNHRFGLDDAVLIKTNHLKALRQTRAREAYLVKREAPIAHAIRRARQTYPNTFLEVEVTDLREFRHALDARPNAVLLDNWSIPAMRKAVALRNTLHASRFTLLEASGGVTLDNVRAIARTGVDRISVGRLTHSAPALDVSLQVV